MAHFVFQSGFPEACKRARVKRDRTGCQGNAQGQTNHLMDLDTL